jgi:hypothetical protein
MQNYKELQDWLQIEKETYFGKGKIKYSYKFRKTLKYEILKEI